MLAARRGAALLEVMIALTLLTGAGVTLVSLLGASLRSEAEVANREARYDRLDRTLTVLSLLSRADLDQRIGRRTIGDVVADVQRPEPELYRIAVGGDGRSGNETLVTVVYRPDQSVR